MEQQDIVDALDGRLQLFPGVPAQDVAWEGLPYQPTKGRPFLSPRLSSYVRTPVGAGVDSIVQHDGTYTVMVQASADDGRRFAGQIAGAVRAFFERGTVLAAAGQPLILLNASPQPSVPNGDWIGIPVVVTFTASAPPADTPP